VLRCIVGLSLQRAANCHDQAALARRQPSGEPVLGCDEGKAVRQYTLQVGADAFWGHAARDIASARRRVLVQAMTFEGDAAGKRVAASLEGTSAADRRVLVDDYTRHVINDTVVATSRDASIHAEARATAQMFEDLARRGVAVRVTNPIAGRPLRYPLRNHKKLLVVDDAAWLGGINFSDHNFDWHDLMVRIEDGEVADWLAGRFEADWDGRSGSASRDFAGGLSLLSLDGRGNPAKFEPLIELLAGARRSIEMLSPYPTFPFVAALARAARQGAAVTLYTPRPNNKPVVRDYLLRAARRSGIAMRLLPEMTHCKLALIDGETLLFGSCNFDFVSYRASAELIATCRDPDLIAQVEAQVLAPARQVAVPPGPAEARPWRGLAATGVLRTADALIALLECRPSAMPWPQLAEAPDPG
jgi:cardiolipin synthase